MNPQDSTRFRQIESQYFILRGQLDTGRLTRAQFESQVQGLMITDAQGRYWAMSPDSARWHMYDGKAWREADPFAGAASAPPPPMNSTPSPVYTAPPTPQPAAAPPPTIVYAAPPAPPTPAPAASSGGWGCGRILACGCLAIALLVVVCGIGGYWGFTSGTITLPAILKLVGMGPSSIEVDNFRDDRIDVALRQLDAAPDSTPFQNSLNLNAFDVKLVSTPQAGRYQVLFNTGSNRTPLGACTLTIRSGDLYQFVALPDKVVVNRVNNPSTAGRDLVVQTSALCR